MEFEKGGTVFSWNFCLGLVLVFSSCIHDRGPYGVMLRRLCFDPWGSLFILCLLPLQPASSYGDPVCCCSQGLHHPGQARVVWRKLPGSYGADPGQDTFRKQQAHLLPRKVSIFWGGKGEKKCWKPIMGRNERKPFSCWAGEESRKEKGSVCPFQLMCK